MYLLVFVFLIMSIIGLYTQLYALQVAQIMAQQKGVGEMMLAWHGGAYLFARFSQNGLVGTGTADTVSGCLLTDLTSIPALAAPPSCSHMLHHDNALNDNVVTLPDIMPNFIPGGSNSYPIAYKWYSIIYAPGGPGTQQYVITFAEPGTAGVTTTNVVHPSVGFSPAEILHQLKNAGAPTETYGLVASGQLVTMDAPPTPRPTYALPTTAGIPNGSVALITPL